MRRNPPRSLRTVGPEHLEEFGPGSPERTVLEWWRHVQYHNPDGAYDLYSDDADVSRDDVERQITFAASSFVGAPEIADVDRDGELATVYMTVQPPGSDSPPRPLSANLREEGSSWRLRDNALMQQQVGRVARARASAEGET